MTATGIRTAVVAAVAVVLALSVQECRLSDARAALARATLPVGFTPRSGAPRIAEVPRWRQLAELEGAVRYLPTPPATSTPSYHGPCDLDSITVDLRCRAQAIDEGGRLVVSGTLFGFDQRRDLPEVVVGDPTSAPETQPVETAPPEIRTVVSRLPRNAVALGVDSDTRVELRYERSLSDRWAVWGAYRRALSPDDGDAVAAGVELRF